MEMKGLCNGNISADTGKAVVEGSMLMMWHVMLVLQQSMKGLLPYMRSLDLQAVASAKMVYANFQALQDHISLLMADPERLNKALDAATAFVLTMQKEQQKVEKTGAEAQPAAAPAVPSSIVLTD
mgnify:CR=1 FL=1